MDAVAERLKAGAREVRTFGEEVLARFGGPMGAVAAFSIAHTLLVLLGYALKESIGDPHRPSFEKRPGTPAAAHH